MHTRPGESRECDCLLPMWRDGVRSLPVDAAAYGHVLGALSINATVCECMELVSVLVSTLQRKCGDDVGYLGSTVGSPFFTQDIDVARVRHWFGDSKGFHQISRLLQVLSSGALVDVAPGGDLQPEIAQGNHPNSESHTGAFAPRLFTMS